MGLRKERLTYRRLRSLIIYVYGSIAEDIASRETGRIPQTDLDRVERLQEFDL